MQQRVPVIDISPYFHGSAAERKRIAAFVDATCRDIGFLMIEGHGVPASLGERLYETAERFFAQPIEEKQSLKIPWLDSRGWEGAAASNLAETRAPDGDSHAPDLRESFGIGPLRVPANMSPQEAPFFRENVWPHWPLEFRDLAIEYYHAMEVLSADILEVFACALDLPPGFFVNKNDRHISHLVVNHYPAQTTDPLPNQLRAGAHTDFGDITILRADPAVGGLQIRDREGNWSDISSPPHAFVVNLGDLMALWTNNRWVSTLHRVVNPPGQHATRVRQSFAFFHQPNWHAEIRCLPTCATPGGAKFSPTTSGEHYQSRLERLRPHLVAKTTAV